MQKTDIGDLDPEDAVDADRRGLTDPLDTDDLALNYYTLDPGEAFSGGLHAHLDQEEVFYVLEGEATFETKPEPTAESETVTVSEGQAVRFAPGEYQQGRNESDAPVRALAFGAPRDSTDVRVPVACRECGESDSLAYVMTDEGTMLECPECGNRIDAG